MDSIDMQALGMCQQDGLSREGYSTDQTDIIYGVACCSYSYQWFEFAMVRSINQRDQDDDIRLTMDINQNDDRAKSETWIMSEVYISSRL
jgi:hypothetical protein